MAIIWRKQMTVGNLLMDEDHRYLFCLANTVELALRTKENRDILEVAIDQLVDYTKNHFYREEMILFRVQYPKYEEHKREHQRIIEKVLEIQRQLADLMRTRAGDEALDAAGDRELSAKDVEKLAADNGDPADADLDPAQLIALIRHWVLDHILKKDLEYKYLLEQYPANYS